ncbi:MAG: STAS domain-containing protein [Armatimonadetes bacterium]|nr:STAS domain-containing protein [Armatimonadota bacterium]
MFNYKRKTHQDGAPVLILNGVLDLSSAAELRNELRRLIEDGNGKIIVDLDGLDYLDSTGLGVLVGALARIRERGGDLPIVVNEPKNRRIFDITKLSYVFPLYGHLNEVP